MPPCAAAAAVTCGGPPLPSLPLPPPPPPPLPPPPPPLLLLLLLTSGERLPLVSFRYEGFAVEALAGAVVAHTAAGGAAYLMCGRLRFEAARARLLALLEPAGSIELEDMCVHNSHGRTELVLVSFRRAGDL